MTSVDAASMPTVGLLPLIGRTPLVELHQARHGPVRAVGQAREPEPRRLDQGPHRPRHDRGRRARRAARAGRDDRRGDRGQHGPRARAGGGAQGLPAAAGHPRQDEPGEDLPPARARRRGAADALRRRQGPPRVLPGPRGAPRAASSAASTSTSSRTRPTRSRTRRRRARDLGARWRAASTPSCAASARAARSPGSRASSRATAPDVEMVLADPAGSILADYVETGKLGQAGSWLVEGIGEDFMPSIADLSRVRQAYTITDEESFTTARALLRAGGHPRGLVVGHAGRGGAALLPRADRRPSAS